MTRIKICGLFRPCDIDFVNEAKPDHAGFVVDVPKSRRSVTPDQLRRLRERLDPAIRPVGVFVDCPAERVAELLLDGTISAAQLHGGEDEDYLTALRALAPGCEVWKAFQVRSPADRTAAERSSAGLVLLDAGQGAGRTFDWSLAAGFPRPYLLAGGLDPDNLPRAVRLLRPFGVDLSSGVETDRVKDRDKICAAVAAVRKEG